VKAVLVFVVNEHLHLCNNLTIIDTIHFFFGKLLDKFIILVDPVCPLLIFSIEILCNTVSIVIHEKTFINITIRPIIFCIATWDVF